MSNYLNLTRVKLRLPRNQTKLCGRTTACVFSVARRKYAPKMQNTSMSDFVGRRSKIFAVFTCRNGIANLIWGMCLAMPVFGPSTQHWFLLRRGISGVNVIVVTQLQQILETFPSYISLSSSHCILPWIRLPEGYVFGFTPLAPAYLLFALNAV